MITKIKKHYVSFIALALAVIVIDGAGKVVVAGTGHILLGQYIDKAVSVHKLTESSLRGSLIEYLDASDIQTKRLFGSVTFSRAGGFTFEGNVGVDSIVAFMNGDKIYNIKFNFGGSHCVTINELDASIGSFFGHYSPPVDSRDPNTFEMQHISSDGTTLYRASLTKSEAAPAPMVIAPSCVNSLSVLLERNK